jgi:arylsulfatase
VRGPPVDNPVMCALNAQTMIARTDLVQGAQYMKVVCAPSKTVDQWKAEIEARRAAESPNLEPSLIKDHIHFTYFAGAKQAHQSPSHNISSITAYVVEKGEGVLVAAGGVAGGYALFVKEGKPTYEYNWFGRNRYRIVSSAPLSSSSSAIRVEFDYERGGPANGGNITMFINGNKVAEGKVDTTMLSRFSDDETLDVGLDAGSPVSDQYASPFKFTGMIDRVEVNSAAGE